MQHSETPRPRRLYKFALLILALLVLIAGATVLFVYRVILTSSPLVSPAHLPRSWAEASYTGVLHETAPSKPLSLSGFTSSTLEYRPGHLLIKPAAVPASAGSNELPAVRASLITSSTARVPDGTVELLATGYVDPTTILPNPPHAPPDHKLLPVQYFSPAGLPLAATSLPSIAQPSVYIGDYEHNPQFLAILRLPNPSYNILEYHIYDAQTHADLGFATDRDVHHEDGLYFNQTEIAAWSPRPIQLVVRIACYGPAHDLPFTTGSLLLTSTTALRLRVAGVSGQPAGVNAGEKIDLTLKPEPPPSLFCVLEGFPTGVMQALRLQFLDAGGASIAASETMSGDTIKIFEAHPADRNERNSGALPIKTIRVQFPEEVAIVKFDLPSIYGLPGKPVTNLFEQVIPRIKFTDPQQFKEFITSVAQVQSNIWPDLTPPVPKFNAEFTNIALIDLLPAYEKLCGKKIDLDPATLTLVEAKSTWTRIHEWLKNQIRWFP